jgi:predicted amidohydrolase YtcJ
LIGHVYYYGAVFRDKILGAQRADLIDPMKSALECGLTPTIHSDYNCQPVDPLRCIYNAVTRIMKDNGEVLNYKECVSPYQAVKAMTINAAWQCHMEDIVGSLKKGKFADFVIL